MVEVSTDKVDAEVPAPATGDVTKILVARRRRRSRSARRWPRSTRTASRPRDGAPATDGGRRAGAAGSLRAELAKATPDRAPRTPRPTADHGRRLRLRRQDLDGGGARDRRCPRWASRSPRAPCSSGTSPRATQSRRATPSSRSPPTRSTPRSPPRPAARSPRSWSRPTTTVKVGQPLAEMTAGRRPATATAPRRGRAAEATPRPPGAAAPARRRRRPSATPVARRAAAANGVDLGGRRGLRPRRQGHQGRRARGRRRRRRGRAAPPLAAGRGQAAARPRGDARQGDGREPLDPDRDLVPDPRRRHARRQAQGAQRRPQGARHEGLASRT